MSKTLDQLIRPNIKALTPYSCARNEFKGTASVWLDANENPYNSPYNRYPDPLQCKIKHKIGEIKEINEENIFLGVGSDECIDLCYRIFCRPGVDNVVAISPTYGMYEVCAEINDVEYRKVPLLPGFEIDVQRLLNAADENSKVLWICSPNNPTGNAFDLSDIRKIYDGFQGIVVVDEAYIDFSGKESLLNYLAEMPRLIVMQTFSKAWACAGVRLGVAYASTEIISIFNKVKYPYNINELTQEYAIKRLEQYDDVKNWVSIILDNRNSLVNELKKLTFVKHIYPSDANFVLVKVDDADNLYSYLRDKGIIIRNRNRVEMCLGCVRITIGTGQENDELLIALKNYDRK